MPIPAAKTKVRPSPMTMRVLFMAWAAGRGHPPCYSVNRRRFPRASVAHRGNEAPLPRLGAHVVWPWDHLPYAKDAPGGNGPRPGRVDPARASFGRRQWLRELDPTLRRPGPDAD